MSSQTTLEENIVELQRHIDTDQTPQISRPKIQRVPRYVKNRTKFEEHYTPRLVSIGPIHHGNTDLKLGEKCKLLWAAKYIKNTGRIQKDLHKQIADNIDELKGHFSDDVLTLTGKSLKGFRSLEEKLSWMLFVDGCSLLHILEKADLFYPEHMNMKVDQLALVMMDVVLLENQLPYEVLKLLLKDSNDSELIKIMKNFLCDHHFATPDVSQSEKKKDVVPNIRGEGEHSVSITNESQSEKKKDMVPKRKGEGEHSLSIPNESQSEAPFHLLDLQRNIILRTFTPKVQQKY